MNVVLAAEKGCEKLIYIIENAEFAYYFGIDMEGLAPDEDEIADDLQKAGICNSDRMINCKALSENREYSGYMSRLFSAGICQSEMSSSYVKEMEARKAAQLPVAAGLLIVLAVLLITLLKETLCDRPRQRPAKHT